jgi:hypothetical protein
MDKYSISSLYVAPNYAYAHTRATPWFVGIGLGYCIFHAIQCRNDIATGRRNGLSKVITFINHSDWKTELK